MGRFNVSLFALAALCLAFLSPLVYADCVNLSDDSTWGTVIVNVSNSTAIFYINEDVALCTDTYTNSIGSSVALLYFNCTNCALDCNGSTLDGVTGTTGHAIKNSNNDYTNVSNCIIQNYKNGFVYSNSSHNVITFSEVHNASIWGFYFTPTCDYNRFEGNTLNTTDYGLSVAGNHNVVDNNLIYNTTGSFSAISTNGADNNITNNVVQYATTGISIQGNEGLAENNSVSNSSTGIYLYHANSHVLNLNNATATGSALELNAANESNLTSNNLNGSGGFTAYGAELDGGSQRNWLWNNTLSGATRALYLGDTNATQVFDNTVSSIGIELDTGSFGNYGCGNTGSSTLVDSGMNNAVSYNACTPPLDLLGVQIEPPTPTTEEDLTCKAIAYHELDSPFDLSFTWYLDDVANSTWDSTVVGTNVQWVHTGQNISAGNLSAGQRWVCQVRASDGENVSDYINSTEKTVQDADEQNVSACRELNRSNTLYRLTANITTSTSPCFPITADNVTFDLFGHSLVSDFGNYYGISLQGVNNTRVLNGTVSFWKRGIDISDSNYTYIYSMAFTECTLGPCIYTSYGSDFNYYLFVENNSFSNSGTFGTGVLLEDVSDARVDGNTFLRTNIDGESPFVFNSGLNITNNNLSNINSTQDAIQLNGFDCIVSGNNIQNVFSSVGIHLGFSGLISGNSIFNNTIYNVSIGIWSSSAGMQIYDNNISLVGTGIQASDVSDNEIYRNNISGATYGAVSISRGDGSWVYDNDLSSTGSGYDIRVSPDMTPPFDPCTNHRLYNNTVTSQGIFIDNGTTSTLGCLNSGGPVIDNGTSNSVTNSTLCEVRSCQRLGWPASYNLTADISGYTGELCFNITAGNLQLDCLGHTVDGTDASSFSGAGVLNEGNANVIVQNCVISDFAFGINFYSGADNASLSNNSVSSCGQSGISVTVADNASVIGNYLHHNGLEGLVLDSGIGHTVSSNRIEYNEQGLYVYGIGGSTFMDNNASYNNESGVWINEFSAGNTFTNTRACSNNQSGGADDADVFDNDTTTFNETTCDSAFNATCDYACGYVACINLSDPGTWGTAVVNDSGLLYLNEDATLCGDTYNFAGITALTINASDITLDCNGSTIDGNDTAGTYGINNSGYTNVTIKNCVVTNFYRGISFISGTDYGTLENNTVASNVAEGFYIGFSSSNTLTDNNATSNGVGFTFDTNSFNNLISNTATSNDQEGFYLYSSSNNTLTDNTATSNGNGFYLASGSNDNTFTGNNATLSDWTGFYFEADSGSNDFTGTRACSNNQSSGAFYDLEDLNESNTFASSTYNTSDPVDTGYFDQVATCGGAEPVDLDNESTWGGLVSHAGNTYYFQGSLSLVSKTYHFNASSPAIEINCSSCTVDCNGSIFVGNTSGEGILVDDKQDVAITNCHITNYSTGIYINRTNASAVSDSSFDANNITGVYILYSDGVNLTSCNASYNRAYGASEGAGIFALYSNAVYVLDSNILNNTNAASSCTDGDGVAFWWYTNNSYVNDSVITGNCQGGIAISYGINNSAFNNIVSTGAGDATGIYDFYSTNTQIGYNNVSDMDWAGIRLWTNSQNAAVFNNTVSDSPQCIEVLGGSNATLENNTGSDCTYGLYVNGGANTQTTANTFTNNDYGIYFTSSANAPNSTEDTACENSFFDVFDDDSGSFTNLTCSFADGATCNNPCPCLNLSEVSVPYYLNQSKTLCPDTYSLNVSYSEGVIIVNADDVTLDCAGAISIGNNSNGTSTISGFGIMAESRDNITVRNCNFLNYTVGYFTANTSNSLFENNTAQSNFIGFFGRDTADDTYRSNAAVLGGNGSSSFYFLNSTGGTYELNLALASLLETWHGFMFYGGSGNNFTSNTAVGHYYDGFQLSSESGDTLFNNTGTVNGYGGLRIYNSNNTSVYNNTFVVNQRNGILISAVRNSTFMGNNLTGNLYADFNVNTGADIYCNLTVTTDNIVGNDHALVYYENTAGLDIEDNDTIGELVFCNVSNSTVRNLTMEGEEAIGIYLSDNNTLTDNYINNSCIGFALLESDRNNLTNNLVNNSQCPEYCMYLINSNYNRLQNNTVEACQDDSIVAYGSNYTQVINNEAMDGGDGFECEYDSHHTNLSNNYFHDNTWDGIHLRGEGCDNNTVFNNILTNNGNIGLDLWEEALANTILNNTITYNDYEGIYLEDTTSANTFTDNYVCYNNQDDDNYTDINDEDNNIFSLNTCDNSSSNNTLCAYSCATPAVRRVQVLPTSLRTSSTLNCSAIPAGIPGETDMNLSFTWYVDGVANSSWDATDILCDDRETCYTNVSVDANLSCGQRWICSAQVSNGTNTSDWVNSSQVTVRCPSPSDEGAPTRGSTGDPCDYNADCNSNFCCRNPGTNYMTCQPSESAQYCPAAVECTSNSQCAASKQCLSNTCEVVPCPNGQVQNHVCVPYECTSDSDCTGGKLCQNHVCVAAPPECTANSDCGASQQCANGICEEVVCTCGYYENHACVSYACCADSDCTEGKTCTNHNCVSRPVQPECTTNADCASGQVCQNSVCAAPPIQQTCAATCPAGQTQKAYPDCSCVTPKPPEKGFDWLFWGMVTLVVLVVLVGAALLLGGGAWFFGRKKGL